MLSSGWRRLSFVVLVGAGLGCNGVIVPGEGGGVGGGGDPAAGAPAVGQIRRLTAAQFRRSLQDLLGGPIAGLRRCRGAADQHQLAGDRRLDLGDLAPGCRAVRERRGWRARSRVPGCRSAHGRVGVPAERRLGGRLRAHLPGGLRAAGLAAAAGGRRGGALPRARRGGGAGHRPVRRRRPGDRLGAAAVAELPLPGRARPRAGGRQGLGALRRIRDGDPHVVPPVGDARPISALLAAAREGALDRADGIAQAGAAPASIRRASPTAWRTWSGT